MIVVAWILLVVFIIEILIGPFNIGKETKPLTPGRYVMALLVSSAIIMLCGRVLGWW